MFENNEEVEKLLKKIDEDIKNELSEKRYNHSVGVMKKAEELAKIHDVDINKARLVGLAHDIGKELSSDDKLKYCSEHGLFVDDVERQNTGLLHTKIGADICKRKYNFTKEMQDAIKYHTTGNVNMDKLAKIIFIADKTEENRSYEDLDEIVQISNKDIDEAVLYICSRGVKMNLDKKVVIHPDTIDLINKILIDRM